MLNGDTDDGALQCLYLIGDLSRSFCKIAITAVMQSFLNINFSVSYV